MEEVIIILIVSVFVGMASFAWLMIIVISATKKATNEAVLKRWLKRNGLLIIAVVLMAGCSPGKMLNTGYLVSIDTKEPREFVLERFESADSVDTFILENTGIELCTPELISAYPPYYDVRNGEYYIYVEKQALYQRPGGKTHWKVYDETLDSLTKKNQ